MQAGKEMSRLPSDEDIMRGQSLLMVERLRKITLPLEVAQDVVRRPREYYADRLTLGILSMPSEDNVAILASAAGFKNGDGLPVEVVLIIPGSLEGSLKVDKETFQPAADFFFTIEDGKIVPVQTERPITIDLLLPNFTHYNLDLFNLGNLLYDLTTCELTWDKGNERTYFRKYDIPNPRGVFVHSLEDEQYALSLLASLDNIEGIVVKDPYEHQSKSVRMYPANSEGLSKAAEYAAEVKKRSGSVIVEERIIPPPFPEAGDDVLDWNVRSIFILEEGQVGYLGAFIRYNLLSQSPVSISAGARTCAFSEGSRFEVKIKEFTDYVGARIAQAVYDRGGKPRGLLGLDIMIGHIPLVIETNGWLVGGLDDICRLTGKPLPSVNETMIPLLLPRLARNHSQRRGGQNFKPIDIPYHDFYSIVEGLELLGEKEKVLTLVEAYKKRYPFDEHFRVLQDRIQKEKEE